MAYESLIVETRARMATIESQIRAAQEDSTRYATEVRRAQALIAGLGSLRDQYVRMLDAIGAPVVDGGDPK